MKHIEKKPTQYQPNVWGTTFSPKFLKRETKRMPGGLKEFILQILLFLVKKRLNKNMALRSQFQILILA